MVTEVKDEPVQKEEVSSSETKPGKLLCCPQEGCGKVFRSSPGYRYHLKSHDQDPRPHVCHCCHKKFKSANGLKYHLRKAHHIEPVLSKQNLNGVNQKNCDSLGSEEDHFLTLNDSYSRNLLNGNYPDRRSNIPSPLVKSPLGLSSPMMKNLPGIPSPLLKSPMDIGPYLSGGSSGSGINSPYTKDRYSHFYDKLSENHLQRNGEYPRRPPNEDYSRQNSNDFSSPYSRNSLSEYTQQCQQANNEFRQQCQRLSISSNDNYNSYPSRSSCEYYSCRKTDNVQQHGSSGSFSNDYHRNSINRHSNDSLFELPCINGEKDINGPRHHKDYGGCKDFPVPNEGKEYPNDLANHNPQCTAPHVKTSYISHNSCSNPYDEPIRENQAFRKTHISYSGQFKVPSVQNTEQIVPDIGVPNNSSPPGSNGCDISSSDTPKDFRGASESSTETELSDCAFQNDSSDLPLSPPDGVRKSCLSVTTDLGFQTIKSEPSSPDSTCAVTSAHALSSSVSSDVSKPLLVRRTSKSKSIPSALVINPGIKAQTKVKDLNKLDPASRLRHLAEIATSPRSPLNQIPLPLALTPSLLPPESTPHIPLKSPSRFSFPEKPFLLTPTISRFNAETSHSDSPITTTTSLPASPFLDNIQTPSFWPSQTWPIPVWLCFLQGCRVKFEQDDKEFMLTEDVAAYCTTPGGRRRDDMNFYTSGMKIVQIQEQDQSLNSAQDMVELTFEQIIPGTQRLVAKCPIDHPFYVKNKGWCAASPTEAMARYGIPFRTCVPNDIAIPSPQNKLNPTPCNMSPLVSGKGPQVFTFNVQETSKFSPPKELKTSQAQEKSTSSSCASSKVQDTITLTYSAKSSAASNMPYPHKNLSTTQPKLASELKSISEAMKQNPNVNSDRTLIEKPSSPDPMVDGDERRVPPRKKRRKPVLGNQEDRRPMNGFMLFAKKMRVELTKLYPGKDNRAVSKLLGEKWRELSEDNRDDFARSAKEMADERMKVNPDCWKRKHRKDKDSVGKTGEGMPHESKKPKLPSPQRPTPQRPSPQRPSPQHMSPQHPSPQHKANELQLPSAFMDNSMGNPMANSLLLKVGDSIKVEETL